MNKKLKIQIISFNLSLIIVNIICFSKAFLDLLSYNDNPINLAINGTIIAMTIFSFFYVNYKLLTSNMAKYNYHLEKVDSSEEYIAILNESRSKTAFTYDINESIDQIGRLLRKQKSLDGLLYQKFHNDKEASAGYREVINDAIKLFYKNIKRIITSISIFDQQEYDSLIKKGNMPEKKKQLYEENMMYIKKLLHINEDILLNFDQLLSEISKIGDTSEADEINLRRIEDIISNMKSLRISDDNDELIKKYE